MSGEEKEIDMEIEERVAKGVQALDLFDPQWADRIDLKRFDIGSGLTCVLGQQPRGYWLTLQDMSGIGGGIGIGSPMTEWAAEHGFDISARDEDVTWQERETLVLIETGALNAAWKPIIAERQQGDLP